MDIVSYFHNNPEIAIAFSGGVDSAYLLYLASKYAKKAHAYYVKTEFQPEFELKDAKQLADHCGIPLTVLPLSQLCRSEICANDRQRCYYCKLRIMATISEAARRDGFSLIADGTNADDKEDDRPGFRALRELGIRSPLRELGLTKEQIRKSSKEAGLFTHDKPAYACLATRISAGEPITLEKLQITETAESFLHRLGFRDFRIRWNDGVAKLQINEEQFPLYYEKEAEISTKLNTLYKSVLPHPEVRK